jgi:sensor histidine kinase YesM
MLLSTLRALGEPRRAIPLGIVAIAMLSAEWFTTRSPSALALDAALLSAFCLVAPTTWRWLGAPEHATAWRAAFAYAAYVLLGTVVVVVLGLVLPWSLALRWTYVVEPSSFGVVLVLFLVGGWGLGRDIELEQGVRRARLRADRLALEAQHAQLLALRAQLDPHFLFNTLNAIAEWCREDPVVAEKATLRLAHILRAILEGIHKPSWSLREELALLTGVFELFRIRDDERYRLQVDAPDELPDATLPPMLLLPLFENAITHGPGEGHAGEVSLRLEAQGDAVRVTLRNPGAYAGRREGGEGIAMVERRLSLAYGNRASLSIEADGQETVTVVSFPMGSNMPEEFP